MKKFLVIAVLLVAAATTVKAQDYNWAIGVRGGGMASGLTVKHTLGGSNAWEGTLNTWYGGGFVATALYEWGQPVIADGFTFYYGIGGHLGAAQYDDDESNAFAVGADAVVGLEYLIPGTPIAFSLDYRPHLNLAESFHFGSYDVGLGVKFCF